MRKKQYIIELKTQKPYVKKGMNNDPDVRKVQEWINLWKRYDPNWMVSAVIDGDFGPVTFEIVKEFQKYHKLTVDGIVGNITWRKLSEPMKVAYTRITDTKALRELVVRYAQQHLKASPREFKQNEGTWVRAYMDGHEGSSWPWCMGFVQSIIDQASFTIGKALEDYMPLSYSCDVVGNYGLKNKSLIRNSELRKKSKSAEPGDIFLNVRTPNDWTHTGIITKVDGDWFHTIEGNTNDEGSREGYEVCQRKRNFMTKDIDVFKLS